LVEVGQIEMRKEYGGMGFRHFFGFSLAMLGKQGWKLLANQDTIVARIYKARYFSNTDFLGARLGHNQSNIWRSIFASQVIVRGGQRWRIGDGRKIKVWADPWLREGGNSYISSEKVQGIENIRVADLMDSAGIGWNWDLIGEIFNERDKDAIARLALINREGEDKLIWKFDPKGNYTVKSAYRYAIETLVDNEEYRVGGEWLKMWKLQIPHKIKVFLWRALRGVLPMQMRLQDRGVPCTGICPFCETNYENDWHVFIGCEEAKNVWRTAGMWELIENVAVIADIFVDCIFSLLCRLSVHQCNDMAMMLWCLWRRRNDKVWDGELKRIHIVVQLAREFLDQCQVARSKSEAKEQQQEQHTTRWQPPELNFVKCNVDAALFEEQRSFGIGMCIRNNSG